MFNFDVLVQRSLRAIRFLAGLNLTAIMSFNFPSSPPESFFAIVLALNSLADLLAFLFKFGKTRRKFIALVEELSHLAEENGVVDVDAAELVVVVEVVLFVNGMHLLSISLVFYYMA